MLIKYIQHIYNISLVKSDAERFDKDSFVIVDVDGSRVAIYVMDSREITFLFVCPKSFNDKLPWEILFKSVHKNYHLPN